MAEPEIEEQLGEYKDSDFSEDKPGGKPTPKRRGVAWNDEQTDLLLQKWSEYRGYNIDSEKESHVAQNSSIYKTISNFLISHSVDKTAEQCKTRIHTLKRSYKVCRQAMVTDPNAKKMCRYYDKIDYILGHRSKDPMPIPVSEKPNIPSDKHHIIDGLNCAQYKQLPSTVEEPVLPRALWPSDPVVYTTQPEAQAQEQESRLFMVASSNAAQPAGTVCIKQEVADHDDDASPEKKQRTDSSDCVETGGDKSKENGCTYAQLQNVGSYPLPEQTGTYTTLKNMTTYSTLDLASLQGSARNKSPGPTSLVETPGNYPHVDGVGHYVTYGKSGTARDENANTYHAIEGDAIQRLKLDLEIKKIEMERQKLEMEERQRREEREHQFRMMQLILNGLGQGAAQNAAAEHSATEIAEGFQAWRQQQSRHVPAEQEVQTYSESQYASL